MSIKLGIGMKMKTMSDKSLREIQEFEHIGFARSSPVLLKYIRKYSGSYVRMFKYGVSARAGRKGATRYSSMDLFGTRVAYLYDIKRKKEFVDFLVNNFLIENPNPDMNIRKAFTHVLHANGLHWEQCCCIEKGEETKRNNGRGTEWTVGQ